MAAFSAGSAAMRVAVGDWHEKERETMLKSGYDGRLFEFENTYFYHPETMGFVKIWQIGELSTEPGYEMPTHLQICHEISYVISGKGVFYSASTALPVQPGDIHFVPKGKTHRYAADPDQNLRFAYVGFEFSDELEDELKPLVEIFDNPPSYLVRDMGEVRMLVYMLINEMYSKPIYNRIMVECYIKQILVQVYRLLISVKSEMFLPEKSKKIIGQSVYSVVRYIDNNIYDITSIQSIAETLGYSHSHLSHMFKDKMGITLQTYVSTKKIEASLDLLKYKKSSIAQIAMSLNYESAQSFSKVFRKIMGCSPTEYQKQYEQEKEKKGGDPVGKLV